MIRNKSSMNATTRNSCCKAGFKITRPMRNSTTATKNGSMQNNIKQIIYSLERNVNELKNIYVRHDHGNKQYLHDQKQKKSHANATVRIRRSLHKNPSLKNLHILSNVSHGQHQDKNIVDVFQIKRCFTQTYGKDTNNLLELFDFYRKNCEKKEKSTRIMGSMEFSSNNFQGSYDEIAKESLIKQREANQQKQNCNASNCNEIIIPSQKQSSIVVTNSSNYEKTCKRNSIGIKSKEHPEKPSRLACDLIRKGCYNLVNVTNLLVNKKYKIKSKSNSIHQHGSTQKKSQINKQIKIEIKEVSPFQNINLESSIQNINEKEEIKQFPKSQQKHQKTENDISFSNMKVTNKILIDNSCQGTPNKSSHQNSSKKKNSKNSGTLKFQETVNKKLNEQIVKSEIFFGSDSPILVERRKDFARSKFYVGDVPLKNEGNELEDCSISLKSSSRIIDLDGIPFDL